MDPIRVGSSLSRHCCYRRESGIQTQWRWRSRTGKDIQDARVSNDVQYLYVVVCDKNCPAPQYAEIKKEVNRLPFVKLITLVSGVHLNGYESKCRDESSRGQWLQQEEAAALVLGHASRSDFITLNAWLRRSFTP